MALYCVTWKASSCAAKACPDCHGYIKVSCQDPDMQVEPLADDRALLDVTLLVVEAGNARFWPSPLVLMTARPAARSRSIGSVGASD